MTGTEECSAKMAFSHTASTARAATSLFSPSIPIWKHVTGRNCSSGAQRRRQSCHRGARGGGGLPSGRASEREANQSRPPGLCTCDPPPEHTSFFKKSRHFRPLCNFCLSFFCTRSGCYRRGSVQHPPSAASLSVPVMAVFLFI